MPWSHHDLAIAMADGLRRRERALLEEQAVHGLDALAELDLHPLLAAGITAAGYTAFRETPYPGQPEVLPRESERERCDLVVAPPGCAGIADGVRLRKEALRAAGTLFASVAEQIASPPSDYVPPEDALWLEVKTFGQYTYTDGLAGPNRTYSSQFGVCLADVRKLARAPCLTDGALALILFTQDEEVAAHDLAALAHRCLDRDLPVTGLSTESLAVSDRIGNRCCTVALLPVRCGGEDYAG